MIFSAPLAWTMATGTYLSPKSNRLQLLAILLRHPLSIIARTPLRHLPMINSHPPLLSISRSRSQRRTKVHSIACGETATIHSTLFLNLLGMSICSICVCPLWPRCHKITQIPTTLITHSPAFGRTAPSIPLPPLSLARPRVMQSTALSISSPITSSIIISGYLIPTRPPL